jgi:putative flippase GtrA
MTIRQPPESLAARMKRAVRNPSVRLKALSFAMIGVVNFTVDFGMFSLFYYVLSISLVLANIMSWGIAVTGSYVMNSMITFAAESGRRLRIKDYLTFILSQVGGLIANTATVFVASYLMEPWMAKFPAIGASFVVNFSLSHFLVFRRNDNAPGRTGA